MGGFDYADQFTYEAEGVGFGIVGVIMAIYLLFMLAVLAFGVLCYVFSSIGLHAIAKRRGIRHGWLAWIPIGSMWLLGSISDQYQYVVKGKIKNKRRVLLCLSIAAVALYLMTMLSMVVNALTGNVVMLAVNFISVVAFWALIVWRTVYEYMAYYDLYRSCEPENAVLYLVLTILFPVVVPFFLFALRKKELGMPPRKVAPVEVIPETVVEAAEEPVEEGFAQPEEFEE